MKYSKDDTVVLQCDLYPFYMGQNNKIKSVNEEANTYNIEAISEPLCCLDNVPAEKIESEF